MAFKGSTLISSEVIINNVRIKCVNEFSFLSNCVS